MECGQAKAPVLVGLAELSGNSREDNRQRRGPEGALNSAEPHIGQKLVGLGPRGLTQIPSDS